MGSRRIRIEHCRTINSGERILPIRPLKICPMGCRASTHIFHFILPLKFGLAVTPFLFNNILASEYNSFVFYNILASHGLEFSSSFVFNDIPASFPVFSPFLGFTHISGNNRRGYFTVKRRAVAKRLRAKRREIKPQLRRRRHAPVAQSGQWLRSVVPGYFHYPAVPGSLTACTSFATA